MSFRCHWVGRSLTLFVQRIQKLDISQVQNTTQGTPAKEKNPSTAQQSSINPRKRKLPQVTTASWGTLPTYSNRQALPAWMCLRQLHWIYVSLELNSLQVLSVLPPSPHQQSPPVLSSEQLKQQLNNEPDILLVILWDIMDKNLFLGWTSPLYRQDLSQLEPTSAAELFYFKMVRMIIFLSTFDNCSRGGEQFLEKLENALQVQQNWSFIYKPQTVRSLNIVLQNWQPRLAPIRETLLVTSPRLKNPI